MPPPPLSGGTVIQPKISLLAIWSFILGIIGCLLIVPAVAGIVCALSALWKIRKSQGMLRGGGLATGGLFVSCVPLVVVGLGVYCWRYPPPGNLNQTLAEARQAFATQLTRQESAGDRMPEPPPELKHVHYRSPVGELGAYLSVAPDDGKKRPAIVWLAGGFRNSIGESAWEPADDSNDQSARCFREAGVVTLYPSLRGGNQNPGFNETFFGEVNDVIAATEFLSTQPGIDPERIYLGGHSSGATLALLVAESSPRYRAVFAFGPIGKVRHYGPDVLTFDTNRCEEFELRNPVMWLHAICTPTYVIEGEGGNIRELNMMKRVSKNGKIKFLSIAGKDHIAVLAPYSRMVAKQIAVDTNAAEFRF